ncbi:MAG: glycerol-3-phosphate acyltransferase [Eubacteriales bacterium]|nr:glycerol-3-phosphate acyltransferase [Eubacteriales bacterium]
MRKTHAYLFFILFGYLSGSLMFGWLIPKLWGVDTKKDGSDHNPGTANAFLLGGVSCGTLVLLLELAKGFLPVYLAGKVLDTGRYLFALVVAAPVWGHAWPFFWKGHDGGKAIAVSFGVFLGLTMEPEPLRLLIFFYLLFSAVLVIRPHGLRTAVTYLCLMAAAAFRVQIPALVCATALVSLTVIRKNLPEARAERPEIHLAHWRTKHAES